jgi:hypothetical protein
MCNLLGTSVPVVGFRRMQQDGGRPSLISVELSCSTLNFNLSNFIIFFSRSAFLKMSQTLLKSVCYLYIFTISSPSLHVLRFPASTFIPPPTVLPSSVSSYLSQFLSSKLNTNCFLSLLATMSLLSTHTCCMFLN